MHASRLRHMLYTLARQRFHHPQPPFELGGEYLPVGPLHFLRDALGRIEVQGSPALFEDLHEGDLVVVRVTRAEKSERLQVDDLRRESRRLEESPCW